MATAIEKAQAKIAALKQERATSSPTPQTPPKPKPISIPKKPQLRFWAAYRDTELHHAGKNEPLKFVNHELVLTNSDEIVFLRSLVKAFPHKFKELGE